MTFKVTLGIWNAESKEQAREQVNEMLEAYDLHNFSDVEINWEEDGDVEEAE